MKVKSLSTIFMMLVTVATSSVLCGFGSCTPRVSEICGVKIPQFTAGLENAKLALGSWDKRREQNRAVASSPAIENVEFNEREAKIERIKEGIRQVHDPRFMEALKEVSPEMLEKAVRSIPPAQIPEVLRGATTDMVLQAWHDIASESISADVSYMDPRDRRTWKEWAITQLKETDHYLDTLEVEEETKPAFKELNQIAYLLVEFAGYAEQGKSVRMIEIAEQMQGHSERVRALACGDGRAPAGAAGGVAGKLGAK